MEHCEYFMDLLSQSLDCPLSLDDQQALQQHLEQCPECRLISQQFLEIQNEFHAWEDQEVPTGFTEGVMDRIRALEEKPKVIPIWKHRQFKTFGSIAACALICLGLWRTSAPQVTEDAVLTPAAAAGSSDLVFYTTDSTPSGTSVMAPESKMAQAPAEAAAPAALSDANETAPAQASTSYSSTIHPESSSLPTKGELIELVENTLGEAPGALLLVDVLPELAEGELYTTADGSQLLVVYAQPEADMWKALTEQAYLCLELGVGPIVFMTTT